MKVELILYTSKLRQKITSNTSKWGHILAHQNYVEQSTSKQRRIFAFPNYIEKVPCFTFKFSKICSNLFSWKSSFWHFISSFILFIFEISTLYDKSWLVLRLNLTSVERTKIFKKYSDKKTLSSTKLHVWIFKVAIISVQQRRFQRHDGVFVIYPQKFFL